MEVILASKSPRRLQLLQAAGLAVEVRPAYVDESGLAGESVRQRVQRLAAEKAAACPHDHVPVIAADTLVAIGETALGQPTDGAEAKRMLESLSGRDHQVLTGVCVKSGAEHKADTVCTRVRFRRLSEEEIDIYLQHSEVTDKAGAYAIQEGAASFVEAVEGPLDNVIGLPVRRTLDMLSEVTQA